MDVVYSEKKVNQIISDNHSFDDITLLRRELIDNLYLKRNKEGSEYIRNK